MKRTIWTVCLLVGLVVLTLVTAPKMVAMQRRACSRGAAQAPEAQALLSQQWARAHARPGH